MYVRTIIRISIYILFSWNALSGNVLNLRVRSVNTKKLCILPIPLFFWNTEYFDLLWCVRHTEKNSVSVKIQRFTYLTFCCISKNSAFQRNSASGNTEFQNTVSAERTLNWIFNLMKSFLDLNINLCFHFHFYFYFYFYFYFIYYYYFFLLHLKEVSPMIRRCLFDYLKKRNYVSVCLSAPFNFASWLSLYWLNINDTQCMKIRMLTFNLIFKCYSFTMT